MKVVTVFYRDLTFDAYTVIIGNDVYGMSDNPLWPQGFNQYYCQAHELDYSNLGVQVKHQDLPVDVVKAIQLRIKEKA
jgi:hypothetical protein